MELLDRFGKAISDEIDRQHSASIVRKVNRGLFKGVITHSLMYFFDPTEEALLRAQIILEDQVPPVKVDYKKVQEYDLYGIPFDDLQVHVTHIGKTAIQSLRPVKVDSIDGNRYHLLPILAGEYLIQRETSEDPTEAM